MGRAKYRCLKNIIRQSTKLINNCENTIKKYKNENALVKENTLLKISTLNMDNSIKALQDILAEKTDAFIVANAHKEYLKGRIRYLIKSYDNRKFFKNPIVKELKEILLSIEGDKKIQV